MKKKLLFLLVLFMPFFINAKEKCNIISGNGKDIGSEIVCNKEHFYVIENKEDSVRLLSKYNLDFGEVYNKVTVSAERYNEIKNNCSGANYCSRLFSNFHEFYGYESVNNVIQNDDGSATYLIYYSIEKDETKQSSKAIGAHGDEKGNPEFPEYGVVDYYSEIIDDDAVEYGTPYGNKTFIDYNIHSLSLENSNSINHILNEYKTYMNDNGFDIINYDLLSVNELNNLTYKITKSYLPLEEWADNEWEEVENIKVSYWIVGSIKEYLPDEFDWIYGTTYWTKTAIPKYYDNSDGELDIYSSDRYLYFVDTLGNLCNAYGCDAALGAGIRPVIEISKDDIDYNPLPKCNIVSGDGQNIGSEIECAGEHFYVIDNKKDSLKVLAKYNLDIGSVFNKITISSERYNEIIELCSGSSYCDAMFNEKEFNGYHKFYDKYENDDGTYTYVVYYNIENSFIKQSSKAIGAHGDEKGNPEFPEYGIISEIPVTFNIVDGNIYNEVYIDYMLDDTVYYSDYPYVEYFYNDYIDYLNNQGIMIDNLDILSVKDIDNLVYKISGNRLPLNEWADDDWKEISGSLRDDREYYILGSVKDYLPSGYEWLYSTTYWTKTAYVDDSWYFYFMDSLGNLCNMDGCNIAVGAGIRPVAEISKASINYNLIAESEEGGSLEKVNEVKAGDTIVLKPMAKAGYKLKGFTITTDSGKTIEVKEKDIIKNDDGTITINPDVFVMPLENVIITARWGFTNPKTGVFDYISFILVGLLISFIGYISINYQNKRLEF